MRKQTIFESNDEHQRKLESLSRVHGHESHRRVTFVIVLIRNECRVIDKLAQSFDSLFVVVDRRVDEFLKVLESSLGFVSALRTQREFVTRLNNRCTDD